MVTTRLVIHSGGHKTGSSAIQRYLFQQREQLGDAIYLHRDTANSSLWMLHAFKRDLAELPAFRHLQLTETDVCELRERARERLHSLAMQCQASLAVLSAEAIASFSLGELNEMKCFLAPLFSRVEIHQYFRPMKSRMESAYQERLKHRFASLEKKFHLGYNRRIELLDEIFGRENVNIHKYDATEFPGGDVVAHFLSALDLPVEQSALSQSYNEGLSLPAVQLLYVYRKFNPSLTPADRAIVKQLSHMPGDPFRFHSALYHELLANGPNAVFLFEQRVGFSITENLTADDAIGIRSEQDLAEIPQQSLRWLSDTLSRPGGTTVVPPADADLSAVAALVASLHEPG